MQSGLRRGYASRPTENALTDIDHSLGGCETCSFYPDTPPDSRRIARHGVVLGFSCQEHE